MDIVNRIKELAFSKGKSIKDIGVELGLGENAIYRWSKSLPKIENLQKVADYFDVSTDYLLGRTNIKKTKEGNSEVDINDNTVIMTLDGEELSESDRQVVLAATRALLAQRKTEKDLKNK